MYDVLIIGAGVTGASVARRLAKYNLRIGILERENDVAMGASKANSAIVHGGYAEPASELRGRICYPGRKQFAQLNEELNFGFLENGSLVIGFDEVDLQQLKKLYERGVENGLDDMELLTQEEIRVLEPNISPEVKYALYCKGAGVMSPYEYVIALAENAVDNGVELNLYAEVVDIEKEGEVFHVHTKDGKVYDAKFVVNASGLSGAKISSMITPTEFTIHPRSGEYLLFRKGTGSRVKTVLFQVPTEKSKGILVTRTYHNNLLLGPDAIDEEEINCDTHEERLGEIYRQAQKSVQQGVIEVKEFIRSFTGLRPASSTGDFIIEKTATKGFINAVGIQSPGLTASPEVARIVEELLQEEGLVCEENPSYNPYRKGIIQYRQLEQGKDIKERVNLSLGDENRLVCRCEQVSEKTIRDAMSRSLPVNSIDAVKRRTRAGMGFCQGGFCRARVAELMEDVLGREVDSKFDIEHSGINRVSKENIVEYLKRYEQKAQEDGESTEQ